MYLYQFVFHCLLAIELMCGLNWFVVHIFFLFIIVVLLILLFFSNFHYWDKWYSLFPNSIRKSYRDKWYSLFPNTIRKSYSLISHLFFLTENISIRIMPLASLYAYFLTLTILMNFYCCSIRTVPIFFLFVTHNKRLFLMWLVTPYL